MPLRKFEKQPGDTLDYDIDYDDFFGPDDDDDIDGSSQVSASIAAPGGTAPHLELDGPPIAIGGTSARRAKVWLKGGVDGYVYKVIVVITSHKGRVKEQDFLLRIREK